MREFLLAIAFATTVIGGGMLLSFGKTPVVPEEPAGSPSQVGAAPSAPKPPAPTPTAPQQAADDHRPPGRVDVTSGQDPQPQATVSVEQRTAAAAPQVQSSTASQAG